MHDEIRKFSLSGELGEPNIVATKERLVSYLESLMRDYSFVPSLDNDPQFTLNYSPEGEVMEFELTVYGVPVEKDKAWQIAGMMNGKEIPRYTPQHR